MEPPQPRWYLGRPELGRRRRVLEAIAQIGLAVGASAVSTAEDGPVLLEPVPEDAAAAVRAVRGHGLGRALQGVEGVRAAGLPHLEHLVVLVPADVASSHG